MGLIAGRHPQITPNVISRTFHMEMKKPEYVESSE